MVTYEVVISAPNSDLKLKPGLTANVTIITQEKQNVLAAPVAALRFAPLESMLEPEGKIIDCKSKTKVWIKNGKNIEAIAVKTGISNGALTEITEGVSAGKEVLTGFSSGMPAMMPGPGGNSNPFMPGPPGRKKSGNK